MPSRILVLCLALLASCALSATSLDVYGRLPSIEQAALSPDGTKIAFIQTSGDLRTLAIVDLNATKLVSAVRLSDTKVRQVEWADDDYLLVTVASSSMPMDLMGERTEWHMMTAYGLKTK